MRRYLPTTLRQRLLIPVLAGVLLAVMVLAAGFDHELRALLAREGRSPGAATALALTAALALGGVTGFGLWRVLGHILFRPVDTLLRTLRSYGAGELAARTGFDPRRRGEFAELCRVVDDLGVRLERQRRQQQVVDDALRESEARKAIIVAASRDAIITFDGRGHMLEFNAAAERTFGIPARAVLGRSIGDFLLPLAWSDGPPPAEWADGHTFETHALRGDLSDFPCEVCVSSAFTAAGDRLYTAYVRDLTARRRYERALRDLSFLDDLTRLYNRRGFLRFAEQQLHLADRAHAASTLVFADLDGLKAINDAHGHDAGDRAIAAVADALRETFRQSDVLGRIGGDEFVVLAVESGGEARGARLARLREVLDTKARRLGIPLGLSIGLVRRLAGSRTGIAAMIAGADARMYEEKRRRASGSPVDSAA